MDRELRTENA